MNSEAPNKLDTEVLDLLQDAIGDSMNHIIDLYLEDTPQVIQQMQNAVANKDFTTVGRLAHSLKSSSANLGAMQISALGAELEHSIAAGEIDVNTIAAAIEALKISFDQTRPMFSIYKK